MNSFPSTLRTATDSLLELLMTVAIESVVDSTKTLIGIDHILKGTPPAANHARKQFQEFIMLCIMDALSTRIQKKPKYFSDGKVLLNISKFNTILVDSLTQGYFKGRKLTILDFICFTGVFAIECDEHENSVKTGTKQNIDLQSHLKQVNRVVVYCLNSACGVSNDTKHKAFIFKKIIYHQVYFD
jgi:hypothetical protein